MTEQHPFEVPSWKFIEDYPTTAEVEKLLGGIRPVWGVKAIDYIDHVLPMSAHEKFTWRDDDNRKQEQYHNVWTLYMQVAGRQRMLAEAAEEHGWDVEHIPEPDVPDDLPAGFLCWSDTLVSYREYVAIEVGGKLLGRKPGMAGVSPKKTKALENLETAARGRAIAAWGFGVLPGSGVASVEEMHLMHDERAEERRAEQQVIRQRKSREELIAEVEELFEAFVSERDIDLGHIHRSAAARLEEMFGLTDVLDDMGRVDWMHENLDDGKIQMLINRMRQRVE